MIFFDDHRTIAPSDQVCDLIWKTLHGRINLAYELCRAIDEFAHWASDEDLITLLEEADDGELYLCGIGYERLGPGCGLDHLIEITEDDIRKQIQYLQDILEARYLLRELADGRLCARH